MTPDPTIESMSISAIQKAVATFIIQSLTRDARPAETEVGTFIRDGLTQLTFNSCEVDRDYAYCPLTVVARLMDDAKEHSADENSHPELQHFDVQQWSHHAEPGDEWSYTTLYLVQPGNILLTLSGAPGEFSDDDHDLYLTGTFAFLSDEDALAEHALAIQRATVEASVRYGLDMIGQSLRELPVAEQQAVAARVRERFIESMHIAEPECLSPADVPPVAIEA